MRRLFTPLFTLVLCACAITNLSPAQSLYAAYGSYSAALKGAVAYAQSPTADPKVVQRLNNANQAEPTRKAVAYGKAFTSCLGNNATVVEGIDCKAWDFRSTTAAGYAAKLRAIVVQLTQRKGDQ